VAGLRGADTLAAEIATFLQWDEQGNGTYARYLTRYLKVQRRYRDGLAMLDHAD